MHAILSMCQTLSDLLQRHRRRLLRAFPVSDAMVTTAIWMSNTLITSLSFASPSRRETSEQIPVASQRLLPVEFRDSGTYPLLSISQPPQRTALGLALVPSLRLLS